VLSLATFMLPVLAAALLIGIGTARWIFRGAPRRTDS
jgi:hypothetical protein